MLRVPRVIREAPRAPQVYFTETSRTFQRRTIFLAAFEGTSIGRLLAFHPRNRSVEVLVDGLLMPNGIALEPNADANADSALVFSCDQVRLCRFVDLRTRELTRFAELPGTNRQRARPPARGARQRRARG